METKINHGCGSVRPKGWINTDNSLNAQVQKIPVLGRWIEKNVIKSAHYDNPDVHYTNLNKKWNFKDNSVDVVYASHLFEHLSHKAARLFLSESYRCLKPGGVVRIVVPDLYKLAKKYVTDVENGNENASTHFLWAINLDKENMYPSNKMNFLKKAIASKQQYPHQHKYMYDNLSLPKMLREFGFSEIVSSGYGISNYIKDIKDVEGASESYISIYIEAKK